MNFKNDLSFLKYFHGLNNYRINKKEQKRIRRLVEKEKSDAAKFWDKKLREIE